MAKKKPQEKITVEVKLDFWATVFEEIKKRWAENPGWLQKPPPSRML
jgi:hypothetical protein